MSVNLWYLEGLLERSGASAIFVELAWMSEEWRQSLKLLVPRSLDAHKNAEAPMITMLSCLEIDMEISDAAMKTYHMPSPPIQKTHSYGNTLYQHLI